MIALDTNVVVRLLTNDDPSQAAEAARLVASGRVFLPLSVVLETEWVLRSVYGLERRTVASALRRLLGVSSVTAEAVDRVGQALDWYERGFDFADALHLASAAQAGAERIATFDGRFLRLTNAQSLGLTAFRP
ncbi:MAG: type II toxin-antitoxin system VapC family toxin [Gammaproteobacteria bacterium]|nr:type II toxin-antitoxin system VapC family toxin [Gammaproteobacteria bacterium]